MNIAPGLNGLLAQRQMANQDQASQMAQIGGLLNIQNSMFEQQLNPLKMQQLQQTIADQKRKSDIVNGILGGGQASAGATGGAGASFGGVSGQTGLLDVLKDPSKIAALKMAGIDLVDMFKHQSTPIKYEGGSTYEDRTTGKREYIPKIGDGMTFGDGGTVLPASGYIDTVGKITGATEEAKAKFDIVKVPILGEDGKVTEVSLPRDIAIRVMAGNAPRSAPNTPQQPQTPQMGQDPLISQGYTPEQAATMRAMDKPNAPPMSLSVPASQFNRGGQSPAISTSSIVNGGFGQTPSPIDVKVAEKKALNNVEKTGDLPQAQLRVETQLNDIRRLNGLANEIINSPALTRSVGLGSYAPSIRGGDAAGTEALISSLKAQVSGMKLQAMRDASKTGGAVGNVTEKEWPRLESMIVALDENKMSPALFREKLGELVLALRDAEGNLTKAFTAEYGPVGGVAPTATTAPKVRRFNPQTGKIE